MCGNNSLVIKIKVYLVQLLRVLGYLSFAKIVNYLRLKISYLLLSFTAGFFKKSCPFFISVEPVDFCNLYCPHCPVGQRKDPIRRRNTMKMSLFSKLIDELSGHLLHVIFYFQGEPLLAKHLPEMIRYAHDRGIYTSTSTNAQLLDREMAERLIRSGLDKLIVSVDGSRQESYERYRVGGSLDRALNGLVQVLDLRKELKCFTPFVEMQCLLLSSNEEQLEDIRSLAKKLGVDKLTFKRAQFYNFEKGDPLMPQNPKFSRYKLDSNGNYVLKREVKRRCRRLWMGAVVTAQGEVLPCCFDKSADFSFGTIAEQSFMACWHGARAQKFRRNFLEHSKRFEMCRNCSG